MLRFPVKDNTGDAWYVFELLGYLLGEGHSTRVIQDYDHDAYEWADVVLTQLDLTRDAMTRAQQHRKPCVHLVHHENQLRFWNVTPSKAALIVFNSRRVRHQVELHDTRFVERSVVARPLVPRALYAGPRGAALTLVNLTENKGAPLVWQLAERMWQREFIGVVGGYHEQVLPPADVKNVTIVPNGLIHPVYAQTRLLLMPSEYESWGRVALEAGASGIPTIAHPAGGLVESLRDAGIFVNRDDPNAWRRWIRRFDSEDFYMMMSEAAFANTLYQEALARADLAVLEVRLETL